MKKISFYLSILCAAVLLTSCTLSVSTLPPTAHFTAPPTLPLFTSTPEPTVTPDVTDGPTALPTQTPVSSATVEPTIEPTDKPTAIPTAVPTAIPTATPTPTAVPVASRLRVSVEAGSNLRVRSTPSTADDSNILGHLPNGAVVELVQAYAAEGWHKIRTKNGTEAFLSADFLTAAEDDAPLSDIVVPTPTPQITPEPNDPSGIVFQPTLSGPLTGYIIGINPGHQKKGDYTKEPMAPGSTETKSKCTTGTTGVSSGIPESVVTLSVGLKLRDALLAQGATVVMSRTTQEVNISNSQRAKMFNRCNADLVINLHCNGVDNAPQVNGVLMMLFREGKYAAQSREASDCIVNAFVAATGARRAEDIYTDTLSSFNWSTQPVTLIEMGFMTNAEEDLKLVDDAYQNKMVTGMVNGMLDYFEGRAPLNP